MIRCVRIWTGDDGTPVLRRVRSSGRGARGALVERQDRRGEYCFPGVRVGRHVCLARCTNPRVVITLSGTLDFQTRNGEHFIIRPGDILLAEDTTGSGHSWRLVDEQPRRRVYVILAPGVSVPFVARSMQA